ncbi:cytochrome P450 [Nocardioides sp. WS12]|uniref:cytochrome P450 n=1 Tax=Nocardioides sp. WS12 TaxID=2486272 RepID=UPI0015FB022C|nr:cytochrome P450 [Nocardioides sp. WS12]
MTTPSVVGTATLPRAQGTWRQRLAAVAEYHTGGEWVRDQGLRVADMRLGPAGLVPQVALAVSPRAAHDVLGRHDDALDKNTPFNVQRRLLGRHSGRPSDDLFHMTYQPWLSRKRALQPVFTKPQVSTYGGGMAAIAEEQVQRWARAVEVDVGRATRVLTLEVLGRSVFGLHLGDRAEVLAPHVDVIMTYLLERAVRPARAPYWLPTPVRGRFFEAWAAIDELSNEAMTTCRQDPDHEAPLIRQLLAAVDPETGQALSDEQRRADLLAFLLAGHDTTSTTLAYVLWQVGHRPDIQTRLHAEVDALGERSLTTDDVSNLPYTVQVIHEAMRLCPPVPGVARSATRDVEVDGFRVPQGYTVIVPIYALHRDPRAWAAPLAFDPDRFAPERRKGIDRWQYLPFGGGPRSCIGDHFAMLEATLALATVVRSTAIKSVRPGFPLALGATLTAAEPVPLRFTPR